MKKLKNQTSEFNLFNTQNSLIFVITFFLYEIFIEPNNQQKKKIKKVY